MVTNVDGKAGTLLNGFTVFANAPNLTSIDPVSGNNFDISTGATLSGDHFFIGADVRLVKSGQSPIVATGIVIASTTSINCNLGLWDATIGNWDVIVTNTDGQSDTIKDGFVVHAHGPVITTITPSTGLVTDNNFAMTIAGTDFYVNATVKIQRGGSTIIDTISSATFVSRNQVNCNFDLTDAKVIPGKWSVFITNTDGQSYTLTDGLVVESPPPTVTAITPDTGWNEVAQNPTPITLISGTNFFVGATVKLIKNSWTIAATEITVQSRTAITCTFDLTDRAPGKWSVVVVNFDGKSGTLTDGFNVLANPPVITSIVPSSGWNRPANQPVGVDLAGKYFFPGATVKLVRTPYSDINTAAPAVVVSTVEITCRFDLTYQQIGRWNVVVANTDGQSATMTSPNNFLIIADPPSITSITPSSGSSDTTVLSAAITGMNFYDSATVNLVKGSQVIPGTGVTTTALTGINCNFNLKDQEKGLWSVVVTNNDGQSYTLTDGFRIFVIPKVVSVSPNTGNNTSTATTVAINGNNFYTGAQVRMIKSGEPNILPTGIEIANVSLIYATMDFTQPIEAASGNWDVVVTDTEGRSGSLSADCPGGGCYFIMYSRPPVLLNISPNEGTQGKVVNVSIIGQRFFSGIDVRLQLGGESDIVATSVTVNSRTNLTCTFDLVNRKPDFWNLVVTNTDTHSTTLASAFEIYGIPYIDRIVPFWTLNNAATNIKIYGNNFTAATTIHLDDKKETQFTFAVASATEISALVPQNIETGKYFVLVHNKLGDSNTVSPYFVVLLSKEIGGTVYSNEKPSTNVVIHPQTMQYDCLITISAGKTAPYDQGAVAQADSAFYNDMRILPEQMDAVYEYRYYRINNNTLEQFLGLLQTGKAAQITLSYSGLSDSKIEERLRIFHLDTTKNRWVLVPGTQTVDTVNNTVTAAEVSTFSVFRVALAGNPANDLDSVRIYPNPFVKSKHMSITGGVNFEMITVDTSIEIYTLTGHLVRKIDNSEIQRETGTYTWDLTNDAGSEVASGVYLCIFRSGTSHKIKKMAIVK